MLKRMSGDFDMSIRATARRSLLIMVCLATITSLGGQPSQASIVIPQCNTTNLSLGFWERLSPMTGEHGNIYTLTNRGKFACHLYGYPGISFYDHNDRVLPFKYTRSSSQYMTHASPRTVTLRPNAQAYFLVAKYRCDIGDAIEATTIHVYPPNTKIQLISRATPAPGVGTFSYCKGGTKDPGQIVDISPVRANPHDL